MKFFMFIRLPSLLLLTFDIGVNGGFLDTFIFSVPAVSNLTISETFENEHGNMSDILLAIPAQSAVQEITFDIPELIEGSLHQIPLQLICESTFTKARSLEHICSKCAVHWILFVNNSDACPYRNISDFAVSNGYVAILIVNVGSKERNVIGLDEITNGIHFNVQIPTFTVNELDGSKLSNFTAEKKQRYTVSISTPPSMYKEVVRYLLISLFILFFVASLIFMAKPFYEQLIQPYLVFHYRIRREALLSKAVSRLPIIEWKDQLREKFESCVICMELYELQDHIRILPCSHGFHATCIDSWLLKVRRFCPICKTKLKYAACWDDSIETEISEGDFILDFAYEPIGGVRSTTTQAPMVNQLPAFGDMDIRVFPDPINFFTSDSTSISSFSSRNSSLDAYDPILGHNSQRSSHFFSRCMASVHETRQSQRTMSSDTGSE